MDNLLAQLDLLPKKTNRIRSAQLVHFTLGVMKNSSQLTKRKAKQNIRTLAVGIGVIAFVATLQFTQGTEYKELGIIVAVIIWACVTIALALTVPREVWGHLKKWFGPR